MKAVEITFQAILILMVAAALVSIGIPITQKILKTSVESVEIANIKADFLKCSDKIIDTARTGSGNKCILSASEGKVSVKKDGLYYSLIGESELCAPQDWAIIDINKQVWQRCISSGDKKIYELKWFYPPFVEFDSPKDLPAKVIELTRYAVSQNTTVLSLNIVR